MLLFTYLVVLLFVELVLTPGELARPRTRLDERREAPPPIDGDRALTPGDVTLGWCARTRHPIISEPTPFLVTMGDSNKNSNKNQGDDAEKQTKANKKPSQSANKNPKGQGDQCSANTRSGKGSNSGHNQHMAKADQKVRQELNLIKDTSAFKIPKTGTQPAPAAPVNANDQQQAAVRLLLEAAEAAKKAAATEKNASEPGKAKPAAAAGSASQVATDGPPPGASNKRKAHEMSDDEGDDHPHQDCPCSMCKREKRLKDSMSTECHSFDAIPSYLRDPARSRRAGRRRGMGPRRSWYYDENYYNYYDDENMYDYDYDYDYDYEYNEDQEYFDSGEDPGCEGLLDISEDICFPDEQSRVSPPSDNASVTPRSAHTHEANEDPPSLEPQVSCQDLIAQEEESDNANMEGDLLSAHLAPVDDETGPPINNNLATICSDLWDRALTQPDTLHIKETFDALPRPANTPCLVKTDLNPEIKSRLPKSAGIKDMQSKSAQTAILKAANAMLALLQQIVTQNAPPRQAMVDSGVQALRCLAYGASRVNAHRRQLLRPHLNRAYQSLCDRPSDPSHALLLGNNLAQQARETSETSRLAS